MTETEKRMHRVCFTGHRPEKLTQSEKCVKNNLEKEIRNAVLKGSNVFITGMARGVDIWAAQIVIKIREEGENVKLICAVPYKGFEKRWGWEWRRQYRLIIQAADCVRFICDKYKDDCFKLRNEWMVNHANTVIAVINDENSGTGKTVDYAKSAGVSITTIKG